MSETVLSVIENIEKATQTDKDKENDKTNVKCYKSGI